MHTRGWVHTVSYLPPEFARADFDVLLRIYRAGSGKGKAKETKKVKLSTISLSGVIGTGKDSQCMLLLSERLYVVHKNYLLWLICAFSDDIDKTAEAVVEQSAENTVETDVYVYRELQRSCSL